MLKREKNRARQLLIDPGLFEVWNRSLDSFWEILETAAQLSSIAVTNIMYSEQVPRVQLYL